MKLLSKLRVPYSEDKVYGFLLLSLIVVSMVSVSVFSEPYDSPRFMIWSVLLGLSLFFAIRTGRVSSTLTKPLKVAMLVIWGWALIATIFSIDNVNSLVGLNTRMTSSIWFFSLWIVTVYLFSTLEKSKLTIILKAWMIIGGLMSLWAVFQFFGVGFYEGVNAPVRSLVPSFLANPNFSAMYIASTIFISLWYAVLQNSTKWLRIFSFLFLGLNIVSLMIFASRGAIAGVMVGLIALIIVLISIRKWKVVMGCLLIALSLAGISYLYLNAARDQSITSAGTDVSAQQRWYLWDDAFNNIIKHPLTGSGLGNYFIEFRDNSASYFSNSQWFDDPHNIFLHLAVNGGILFAMVFLLILGLVTWNLYQYYKITKDEFPLYLFASLISWVVAACFNPVIVCNWFLLAILIALSSQYLSFQDNKIASLSKKAGYVLAVVFILAGSTFIFSEVGLWISGNLSNKFTAVEVNKLAVYFNPTNSAAINALAKKQFENGQYDQSYQTYRRLETLHPKSAYLIETASGGYYTLYNQTHDDKYRAEVYRTIPIVLRYFPNYYTVRYETARFYYDLTDYDKALEQAKISIVLSNGDYNSWRLLADIYDKMGQVEKKKQALKQAYNIDPSKDLKRQIYDK